MSIRNKNVYFFYGDDTYSSNEKVNLWRTAFEKKYESDMNIAILDGKKLNSANFESDIQSAPFLAEKRMVIINDFLKKGSKDEQKKVADVLENETPDFCIIVFLENGSPDKRTSLYKKLKKIGVIEEFPLMTGHQLSNWITDRGQKVGLNIKTIEADYMGQLAGSNLWNLKNEIDKLRSYCKDKPVTKDIIDDLVHPNLSTSIFKLTDNLAQKRPKEALRNLNILLESGEEIIMILFMIVRHFRILIQVKDLKERGIQKAEIARKIKQHPYAIQTTMQQSPNFTDEKLREIYEALLQIDIGMKTGRIKILADDKKEMLLALQKFVLDVCK